MKNIMIIRSLPYTYRINGLDLYDSFDAVARREVDPHISPPTTESLARLKSVTEKSDLVYISDTCRSRETASFLSKSFTITPLLNEIQYSMHDFIEKDVFVTMSENVTYARKSFFRAYINNKLREEHKAIISRIDQIFEMIDREDAENVLLISHGFFIKLVEAYVRLPGFRFDPRQLLSLYDGSVPTYPFSGGIQIHKNDNVINFISQVSEEL